ncbi:putative baseplate assembly protein [Actinoplanes sp. NPDC051470]|uniref:putative baseplate assembly protein n=1 Tax=unclassified Actinoplanes TaxID=2626549 RepID=UPI0034136094
MPLPVPNLDDRRFQDLVDEAKRMVQERNPEWTDHNVSDPGVTLIETFAFMTDQLIYRMNRMPDLHLLRFLDLIGVSLLPPTMASADVTFWLSAVQDEVVTVPGNSQVATAPTETADPIVFTTLKELRIEPSRLERMMTATSDGNPVERTEDLKSGVPIPVYTTEPQAGDAVYFGLSNPVPGGAVLLRVECEAEGVGVDPRYPPWEWTAWDGDGWVPCEVGKDSTGGFNRTGDVILHLPASHAASVLGRQRAGWLRCKVVEPDVGQPPYRLSPKLTSAVASTVGGTTRAVHAEVVRDETLSLSEGVPAQRFPLARRPVVASDEPMVLEVAGGDGWQEWREVSSFSESGPEDLHFMVDRNSGEVVFGPVVREASGDLRYYGDVPPKGAPIRVRRYLTGGGRRGNVARDSLTVQRNPVPFVSTVTNRRPASGGVDGETVKDAAVRGPLSLRTRYRAVTAEDYELLAREAAPEAARVRCVPVGPDSAAVRVLVVPAVAPSDDGTTDFADLKPKPDMLARIARYLDERRCLGARISVEPPYYQGVTVVASVVARRRSTPEDVREQSRDALYAYLDPIFGGPEGDGWPFGRPVQAGDIYAVLQRLPGVDLVEDVRLFGADPITGQRGNPVQRLDLPGNALPFSFGHQVRVTGSH